MTAVDTRPPTTGGRVPATASAALGLVGLGWRVLPLDGKVPLTAHGAHDATCDPERVRAWWTRWPSANIGAVVPDMLVVLDVDPRNGGLEGLDELAADEPIPATLTAWSGRGDAGRHLYFLRPAGQLTSAGLPAGIDLKASGYCVVPPSAHPATGRPYLWDEHEIAPLPPRLRARLRPPPPRPAPLSANGDGRPLVEFVARQPEGNRNHGLYWAACRAAEDGALDRIAGELVAAAVAAGLDETSARRTVGSARRRVTG